MENTSCDFRGPSVQSILVTPTPEIGRDLRGVVPVRPIEIGLAPMVQFPTFSLIISLRKLPVVIDGN